MTDSGPGDAGTPVRWGRVALFYVLACAVSWPFFWRRDVLELPTPSMLYMIGPAVAAVVCLALFRGSHPRRITLFGPSRRRSLVCWFVPMVAVCAALAVLPAAGEGRIPLATAAALPILGFVQILGEELGWRGFLQDAVWGLRPWRRYLLIGALWEVWHFTNRTVGKGPLQIGATWAVMIPILALASWGIGAATYRTRSLFVAVTIHAWVNVCAEMPSAWTYGVLALSIPFWWWLLRTWPEAATGDPGAAPVPGREGVAS